MNAAMRKSAESPPSTGNAVSERSERIVPQLIRASSMPCFQRDTGVLLLPVAAAKDMRSPRAGGQTPKLSPQEHVLVAFGFWITNPRRIRDET